MPLLPPHVSQVRSHSVRSRLTAGSGGEDNGDGGTDDDDDDDYDDAVVWTRDVWRP